MIQLTEKDPKVDCEYCEGAGYYSCDECGGRGEESCLEFMMFNGMFKYNWIYAAVGGLSIILGAVYTLRMIQKVFYGELSAKTAAISGDVGSGIKWALIILIPVVLVFGVYPKPLLDMVQDSVQFLLTKGK